MLLSTVVYKIECLRCKSSNIWQTSQILLRRTREHLGSRGAVRAHLNRCAVNDLNECENVSVIGYSPILCKLMTLEAPFFLTSLNQQ